MHHPGNNARYRTLGSGLVLALAVAALAVVLLLPAEESRSAGMFKVESDVAYGPQNGQPGSNQLDIYVPRAGTERPRPVFVWIHGGGWFTGDKVNSTIRYKARTLIKAGFVFVSVNYRLSPELSGPRALSRNRLRFPTHTRDAARALGWVNENIAEFGGNPDRMLIGGDSAGGQIASLLATRPAYLRARGMSTRQIEGVFSLDSVGFNVNRMMTPAYRRINRGFQKMMFNAFGTPVEERRKRRWASASPIRHADRSDPPIFFVVPTTSPDRWRDARQMARRLGQRLPIVSKRVRTEHAGVVPLLGNPSGDMGVTRPLMRFARAAIDRVRHDTVVRGRRVVRANRRSGLGVIRLRISARPATRLITCRLDRGRETACRRKLRLEPGRHKLRVKVYDWTGQVSDSKRVRLRVTR